MLDLAFGVDRRAQLGAELARIEHEQAVLEGERDRTEHRRQEGAEVGRDRFLVDLGQQPLLEVGKSPLRLLQREGHELLGLRRLLEHQFEEPVALDDRESLAVPLEHE